MRRWLMLLGSLIGVFGTMTFVGSQQALERQLAGVRLGAPVIAYDDTGRLRSDCLLSIWGMPDFLAGPPTTPAQGAPGGMPGMPGAPTGSMPGAPFGGGGVGMGSSFGAQPTLPGVMAGVAGLGQLAGSPIGRPSMPSMPGMAPGGMPPGMAGEMPGMPGMPGAPGMPGTSGAATGMPPRLWDLAWVFPPFVRVEQNEVYFVYKRGIANLCFLVELVGSPQGGARMEVVGISVAGERFDGARTAMGDPFKSIKLGDEVRRVFLRYGQPDEIVYFNPVNLQTVPTPTGNVILRYHKSSNIEFAVLNDRVVRIFIFLPDRVTLTR
ncbi:MAG: hypothetical protein LKKZDAJK_000117 [Candidatus Fervidibacter sp.]